MNGVARVMIAMVQAHEHERAEHIRRVGEQVVRRALSTWYAEERELVELGVLDLGGEA